MKRILIALTLTTTLVLTAGCGRLAPTTVTSTYPAPITTEPLPPTATLRPTVSLPTVSLPTAPPTAAVTPAPFNGMKAEVTVDNLFLRAGPGFLLPALEMYDEGEPVEAWGRAPGWSWVYVKTDDDLHGWMKLELLKLEGDFYDLPEVIPDGFIIVRGHVYTPDGSPASHITLTLTPPGAGAADEDAATTDDQGRFYFFLPEDASGTWALAAGAYGCESSAVDASCSLVGSFPPAQQVDVRASAEVWHNLQISD